METDTGLVATRPLPHEWLDRALQLEQENYPAEEAATAASFALRQAQAPLLFRGAWTDGRLVGYVCATRCAADALSHESMTRHDPDGPTVCIHSVSVASAFQRRGIARQMLREYIAAVRAEQVGAKRICLLAH